jgi:hypothetical protein
MIIKKVVKQRTPTNACYKNAKIDFWLEFLHKYIHMNLVACPIMHRFSHKARVDVKNGQLKAIKATLS